MEKKKNNKQPWLTGSGVEIPTPELKIACQVWSRSRWELYLKWYESGRREALLTAGNYEEICEEQIETIFESLVKSETPAKRNLIRRLLSRLPAREADVLTAIYLDGLKQTDVAATFRLSQPRIFQIKQNALSRLKRGLLGDKFIARRFMRGVSDSALDVEVSIWEQPMLPPPKDARTYLPCAFKKEIENLKNHSLREAVLKLPPIAQRIVYLRFWCDLTIRQIARELSTGMNNVAQICQASVSKIKRSVIEFQTGHRL